MTRFIFIRVGVILLIIVAALLIAIYAVTRSLNCLPDCIGATLIGRDLRGANLDKANFTEANLQRTNMSGASLRWADLSGANLVNAVLANADLRGAKLIGADLRGTDLRGAILIDADMSGANLSGADMTQLDLTTTRLRGATLTGTKLVQADLSDVLLSGIDLVSADLSGANLSRAVLAGTSLSRANLSGTILVEADLAGVWFNLADLTGANLTQADLSGASLIGANLASVNLDRARLTGASLIGANFLGTDLRSAVLEGIRLTTSELLPRDFVDPELGNLNELDRSILLVDAKLRGVQYNEETQWPTGKLTLLASLLGQEFAEIVAQQEAALPTPEPTPSAVEEVAEAPVGIVEQPGEAAPAISFALSGPGRPLTKSIYDIFQSQGYTDTIGMRDVRTGDAVALLCETGEVDAILMAGTMTDDEEEKCSSAGYELLNLEAGIAPLVFVGNPAMPFFTDIALAEVPLLFTKEMWSEIRDDWPAEPIMRFFTDPESSVLERIRRDFFAGSETDPITNAPNTVFNPDETSLIQAIATTPNAISLFALSVYLQNSEILGMATIDGVQPTTKTVASGTYTLTQPLMFYSNRARIQEKPELGSFLWFFLDNGNPLLERAGFTLSRPEVDALNRESMATIPIAPPPTAPGEDGQATPLPAATPAAAEEGQPADAGAEGPDDSSSIGWNEERVLRFRRALSDEGAQATLSPVATPEAVEEGLPADAGAECPDDSNPFWWDEESDLRFCRALCDAVPGDEVTPTPIYYWP